MNIRGNNFAGDGLTLDQTPAGAAPPTLNLSHHADVLLDIPSFTSGSAVVNVQGSDTLNVFSDIPSSPELTVNLADHASLAGSLKMEFGALTLRGGADSRYVNNGSDLLQGTRVILHTSVRGKGAFQVESAQSSAGRLEFGGFVSSGQDVEVTGDPYRSVVSHVQIDHPDAFRGSVGLGINGEVDLMGLTNADSFQLKNDILSIYSCGEVIDTLRLTLPPPGPYTPDDPVTVRQTSIGVAVNRGLFQDFANSNATLLPEHQPQG